MLEVKATVHISWLKEEEAKNTGKNGRSLMPQIMRKITLKKKLSLFLVIVIEHFGQLEDEVGMVGKHGNDANFLSETGSDPFFGKFVNHEWHEKRQRSTRNWKLGGIYASTLETS